MKIFKKAKKKSEDLKSKYNFYDPSDNIELESEEPDLTSGMVESIEEKDSENIPVSDGNVTYSQGDITKEDHWIPEIDITVAEKELEKKDD